MPRITDPNALKYLGAPPAAGVQSNGLAPPSGYHRLSTTAVAPDEGGPQSLPYIGAVENLKAGIQTGAEKQVIGARTEADIAAERAKAQIELQKEAAAREAERQFKLQQTPQQRAMANLSNDEVLSAIDQARKLIQAGHSTGMASQILGQFGGTNATDLNGTLNTIKGNLTLDNLQKLKAASTTGASGMGSLTEKEGELLASTTASIDQKQSAQKLLDSLAKIETHYRRWNALNNGDDPNKPDVAKHYGIAAQPGTLGGGNGGNDTPGGPLTLSRDGTKTVIDPTLRGVNDRVAGLIKRGASEQDVRDYLEQVRPGLGANTANIGAWIDFHKQHPDKPVAVQIDRAQIPLDAVPSWVNKAAQSGPGAYTMSAADAASMGTLDNFTSNPALSRAGMAGVQSEHGPASVLGTVTGAAAPSMLAEYGLGKLGLAGGKAVLGARPIAADALYGGAYGAGSNDDNRVKGALLGALAGAGGGVVGRGGVKVAGKALTGVTDAGKTLLKDSGVPLTIGQMAGGWAKGLEDRASSLPWVGDAIKNAQTKGLKKFNSAGFKGIFEPTGQTASGQIGEAGVNDATDLIDQAYKTALGGKQVAIDLPYKSANASIIPQVQSVPRVGPELAGAIDKTVSPLVNGGTLTGEDMQAAVRGLQQLKAGYKNDPLFQTDIAPAIDAVHSNLRGLWERQAPDVMPAYDAANAAFKNFATVRDSVNAAVNTDGVFTPAQLGTQARKNTIAFGGKAAAASGDRPFFDLQRAGQNILPSKIPDSGTAGRLAIPLLAGAVGGGGDYASQDGEHRSAVGSMAKGAALAGIVASPYSAAGRAALEKLLMSQRPAVVESIGQMARRNPRLGGIFASPLALQYYGVTGPQ